MKNRARLRFRLFARPVVGLFLATIGWSGSVPAASFPSDTRVFFQTSGCARPATIGDWYTTAGSSSTARYSEFFVEVTESMSPATISILDAESVAGPGPLGFPATTDEITGANDRTQYQLLNGQGTTVLQTSPVFAGGADNQTHNFAPVATGIYRIRAFTGSYQTPDVGDNPGGTYCQFNATDNDDDNAFRIQVNGASAIDGLLGFLQTTYQQAAGAINYQMYFLVGPDSADSQLQLRNFDLDGGGATVYNAPPNAMGPTRTPSTASGNGVWNGGTGGCNAPPALNSGHDCVIADNDLAGGAVEAGTWGYRINGYTANNQTIFEANNTGVRVALTDAFPSRAGFFSITPNGTLATTIGAPVDHPFTVTNLFFTKDVVNFALTNTSANFTTQLYSDANCSGTIDGADAPLTDNDSDGKVDTGLLASAGQAGSTACIILRVTPNPGVASSDTTQINATSLMDAKVGGGVTTRSVQKTTLLPPSITKNFSPNPLAVGGVSTLTFTLTNINTIATTLGSTNPSYAFTDTFPTSPAAMTLANAVTTNNCGGTLTDVAGGALNAGDVGIRYSGGSIPASSSCTVSVQITAPAEGDYNNTSTAITSTTSGTGNSANATLTVQAAVPPSLSKSFGPNPVGLNVNSTLTLTVTNSNPTPITGLAFNDTYPSGLVNASTPAVTNSCGGSTTGGVAGGNNIGLTGGTLAAGASCSVTVQVRSASAGSYLNSAGPVTSTDAGTGNSASDTLVVHAPPVVSKAFSPDPINNGGISVLTITLTNPNPTAMTGAGFTDTFPNSPAGSTIVIAGSPGQTTTCSGTLDENDANDANNIIEGGDRSIRLTGGVIPASGSCTVKVNVTKATAGTGTNTIPIGGVTTTNGISNTVAASNTLTSQAIVGPNVSKSFSPATIQNGGTSVLTITLTNPNPTAALLGVGFTDTFPAAPASADINIATTPNASTTCGGGVLDEDDPTDGDNAIEPGDGSIRLAGATLPPGASCTVKVNVTKGTSGTGTNTIPIGGVTTTNGGANTVAASADLTSSGTVVGPIISKTFSPDELGINGVSTLTFTITNPNAVALNNIGFLDTYPTNLVNAPTPAVSSDCDGVAGGAAGTTGGVAGGSTIGLTGAPSTGSVNDLAAGASCTLSVQVTSATAGSYNNTTPTAPAAGAVMGCVTNPGGACPAGDQRSGNAAAATVTYVRPTISKSFSPKTIASGGTSTLTLVLGNASDVAFTINNPGFTDVFPAGMTVATPLTTSNTCGGTLNDSGNGGLGVGDVGIRLNNGSIPAHGTCTISVNVTASTSGSYVNTIAANNLSTSGGTNAAAATDTLTVPNRPTIAKAFSSSTIPVLGVSTLTITLSNNNAATPATNAAFTDPLPAGLVTSGSASTNCGGTASSTTNSVSLSGGTIPAGSPGTCTVSIGVLNNADTDATVSLAASSYLNDIPAGALSTSLGTNAAGTSARLNVVGGYKSVRVQTDADSSGGPTVGDTLQWSVFYRNPTSGTAINNFQVSDTLGANMTVTSGPSVSYSPGACSAGAANGGYTGVGNLFNAPFTFNAGCTVRVDYSVSVNGSAAGTTLSNQASATGTGLVATLTDNIDSTTTGLPAGVAPTGGSIAQSQAQTVISPTRVAVASPPTLTKSFSPDPVGTGQASRLTITLTNPNGGFALTAAAFTDTFPTSPGQMAIATTPNVSNTCGGVVSESDGFDGNTTINAGDFSITLSGGTIPAGGSCTVQVDLSSGTVGTYTNTIPAGGLTTSGGTNQAAASDTLQVNPPLTILKSSLVVSDPTGSANPKAIPGAVVQYTVQVANTGAADATSVVVTDSIPANTTYVNDSLIVNAVACPDDDFPAGPANTGDGCSAFGGIDAALGSITAGNSKTVVFRVTVN